MSIKEDHREIGHRLAVKSRYFAVAVYGFLIATAAALCCAQEQSSLPLPPGAEVAIQAEPPEATVGDLIQINLDFTLPPAYQLRFPQLPEQLGEFTVLEFHEESELPASKQAGLRHQKVRIVVAVYKTGSFEFPGLSFRLRDEKGNEFEISSPAVPIRIKSVLSQEDLNLRDLKKQAEIAAPARWLLWLGAGIAIVLLALLLSAWWRKRTRERGLLSPSKLPDLDPLDLAEASLRDLIGQGLLEKGMVKQFYVHLSEILKNALEATYGITTAEKTTGEIIHALLSLPSEGKDGLQPAERELVEILLLSSDIVKFARYIPSPVENDDTLKGAFQLLADCRARRQPVPAAATTVTGVT